MDILVTGAAGFIGSHLAERLVARGDRVTGFDNFDEFYPRAVKERNLAGLRRNPAFRLIEGDLTDPQDIESALDTAGRVDAVVHLAALAGVRPSITNPQRYWAVNVNATLHLFATCRARGIKRFVFGSSSSVYGKDSQVPFCESDPCTRPLSPYAATKRAGELLAFTEHHLYGSSITCLRFFTVYGPRQRPDLAIHKFTRLIASDQPIELFGDGTTSRDYTWIDDILDGVLAASSSRRATPIPHIASTTWAARIPPASRLWWTASPPRWENRRASTGNPNSRATCHTPWLTWNCRKAIWVTRPRSASSKAFPASWPGGAPRTGSSELSPPQRAQRTQRAEGKKGFGPDRTTLSFRSGSVTSVLSVVKQLTIRSAPSPHPVVRESGSAHLGRLPHVAPVDNHRRAHDAAQTREVRPAIVVPFRD